MPDVKPVVIANGSLTEDGKYLFLAMEKKPGNQLFIKFLIPAMGEAPKDLRMVFRVVFMVTVVAPWTVHSFHGHNLRGTSPILGNKTLASFEELIVVNQDPGNRTLVAHNGNETSLLHLVKPLEQQADDDSDDIAAFAS